MKAIFNNEIIDVNAVILSPDNRGFKYGDGFFETIALINGEPRFLKAHLARLQGGAETLRIKLSEQHRYNNIYKQIKKLQAATNYSHAKVKIFLWRKAGGLYAPSGEKADFLITIDPWAYSPVSIAKCADISEKTINYPSTTNRFKTMNAMKYVVAGIEKTERALDEILISDYRGNLSEALSSNIFWKINKTYFTPALSTGCVDGIMRNQLKLQMQKRGIEVLEGLYQLSDLAQAESLFTSNALGFCHILNLKNMTFAIDPLIDEIAGELA